MPTSTFIGIKLKKVAGTLVPRFNVENVMKLGLTLFV
jgi:hypothetical protein